MSGILSSFLGLGAVTVPTPLFHIKPAGYSGTDGSSVTTVTNYGSNGMTMGTHGVKINTRKTFRCLDYTSGTPTLNFTGGTLPTQTTVFYVTERLLAGDIGLFCEQGPDASNVANNGWWCWEGQGGTGRTPQGEGIQARRLTLAKNMNPVAPLGMRGMSQELVTTCYAWRGGSDHVTRRNGVAIPNVSTVSTLSANSTDTQNLYIGSRNNTSSLRFAGYVFEIRIYDALTDAQILAVEAELLATYGNYSAGWNTWTPASLTSPPLMWVDAAAILAGGVTNGSNADSFTDRAGVAWVPAGTHGAVMRTTTVDNSQPYLEVSSTNFGWKTSSNIGVPDRWDIVALWNRPSGTAYFFAEQGTDVNTNPGMYLYEGGSSWTAMKRGATILGYTSGVVTSAADWNLMGAGCDSTRNLFGDKNLVALGSATPLTGLTGTTTDKMYLGNRAGASLKSAGYLAEFIVAASMTAAERRLVGRYLMEKYKTFQL